MVRCLVHRPELAFKDVVRGIKLYDKVMTLLSTFYAMYHKSPLQRQSLKVTFQTLSVWCTPVVPTRIGGTRWIRQTITALEKLWKAYPALVLHLSRVNVFSR